MQKSCIHSTQKVWKEKSHKEKLFHILLLSLQNVQKILKFRFINTTPIKKHYYEINIPN